MANLVMDSTCLVSAFRLMFVQSQSDFTYSAVGLVTWSVAEQASGIICAGAPTLRPFVGRFFPAFATSTQASESYQGHITESNRNSSKSAQSGTVESSTDSTDGEIWGLHTTEMEPLRQPQHAIVHAM
jgi:hypothetical protein